jgi:hypothetical protein
MSFFRIESPRDDKTWFGGGKDSSSMDDKSWFSDKKEPSLMDDKSWFSDRKEPSLRMNEGFGSKNFDTLSARVVYRRFLASHPVA